MTIRSGRRWKKSRGFPWTQYHLLPDTALGRRWVAAMARIALVAAPACPLAQSSLRPGRVPMLPRRTLLQPRTGRKGCSHGWSGAAAACPPSRAAARRGTRGERISLSIFSPQRGEERPLQSLSACGVLAALREIAAVGLPPSACSAVSAVKAVRRCRCHSALRTRNSCSRLTVRPRVSPGFRFPGLPASGGFPARGSRLCPSA